MRKLSKIIISLFIAGVASSQACKVPVFRYALERWTADRYHGLLLYNEKEHTASELAQLKEKVAVAQSLTANIELSLIDVSQLSEVERALVPGLSDSSSLPAIQLTYPDKLQKALPSFQTRWNDEAASSLLGSPLRRELADEILSGKSAVWVIAEGADAAENDRVESRLREMLDSAESSIELPHGVVRKSEEKAYFEKNPNALPEDVLKSNIPLEISFSILRLKRDDPKENYLWHTVRALSGGVTADKSMVFPVFGRGRMLPPFRAEDLSSDRVLMGCQYLLGECSCELKAQNPGVDLLMQVDWNKELEGALVIPEMVLPPLAGVIDQEASDTVEAAASESGLRDATQNYTWRWVVFGGLVIGLTSFFILAKKGSN